ncbi:MAG: ABC transporter ATP-binding protein [Desulfobacteraceae bacterium 4484_190.1]|nr:MAG: ABC transporter ATP-binding protein [Desulfobacteraceae bacterium 4484_190.1]HDH87726.1 ABC transporter ATP-binding protein [Desulfobacteraceae bacterium]
MLVVENIEVKYSGVILVLKGVTLEVPDGSVICLLGPNGSGKTTLLRAVSGMLKPQLGKVTEGSIRFQGLRIENKDPEILAKMGVVQVMEGRRMLEHLTVEENLKLGGYAYWRYASYGSNKLKENLSLVYGYFPALQKRKKSISGYISGGEQQMLAIGRALMAYPRLMLLDEASLGLAPMMVKEIYIILRRINSEEKTTMLLVEQNAQMALLFAEYGYVMETGRIVLDGSAEKLRENEDIKEFYLGLSAVGQKKHYREVKHYKRRKRWLG